MDTLNEMLEEAMARAYEGLSKLEPGTPEYTAMVNNLENVNILKKNRGRFDRNPI